MNRLIYCKFLDKDGNPRGRSYTYACDIDGVKVGNHVLVEVARSTGPTLEKVAVVQVDVKPEDISGYETFKDKIKRIIGFAPKAEENTEEIEEFEMEDI